MNGHIDLGYQTLKTLTANTNLKKVHNVADITIAITIFTSLNPSRLINGLGQDSGNSIADAFELLQSCTKPSI